MLQNTRVSSAACSYNPGWMHDGCVRYNDHHCAARLRLRTDRYISLAGPALPPNTETLHAHKTKASMLGLDAAGQRGNITGSSGAL